MLVFEVFVESGEEMEVDFVVEDIEYGFFCGID